MKPLSQRVGTRALQLLAAALFSACAHTPQHFTAPDSTPLRAAAGQLGEKVTAAKATTARASAAVAAARTSSDRETAAITANIVPRVNELLRVAPVELRPEITALQADVNALQSAHEETTAHLATATSEQATLTGQLEEANAAKNDVAKLSPGYFAQVDKQAAKLNTDEEGWAKDSKALVWYRLHFWATWIIAGLGLLACLALAFLYFTGKLALKSAAVAAKV